LSKDLGVEPTWWEDLSNYEKVDGLTECGDWSPTGDADESDYGDDEYEVEHYESEGEDGDALPHTSWVEDDSRTRKVMCNIALLTSPLQLDDTKALE
jgi:hypothetical protein